MKRGIYTFVVISLLLGLMAMVGCTVSKEGMQGNSPDTGTFSTVVEMNGKELTVGAPRIEVCGDGCRPAMVTVAVKNSAHKPIALAELELVEYESDGLEVEEGRYYDVLSVKQLASGEVQILHWDLYYAGSEPSGSFRVQVKRLE